MKKIKFFLIRNYQRFLRFLISFSAIGCILAASLFASATSPYWFLCDQPQVTNNTAYVEVVDGSGKAYVFYLMGSDGSNTVSGNINYRFNCTFDSSGYLYFRVNEDLAVNGIACYSFYYTQENKTYATPFWTDGNYSYIRLGSITSILGYNCDVSAVPCSSNDSVFYYSGEVVINDKLDTIRTLLSSLQSTVTSQGSAIQSKLNDILAYTIYSNSNLEKIDSTLKSILSNTQSIDKKLDTIIELMRTATDNNYSATTPSQKQNQADLDSAEASINADTAEARTSTINIFKNFTLPGDIMKGMLTVTSLFNALCARLPFAPIILNFSLAVGAAAFLLGLTAVFVRFGRSRK